MCFLGGLLPFQGTPLHPSFQRLVSDPEQSGTSPIKKKTRRRRRSTFLKNKKKSLRSMEN